MHLLAFSAAALSAQQPPAPAFPYPETLHYRVEWRLGTMAGTANIKLTQDAQQDWVLKLDLASTGFVSRLYKVADSYQATSSGKFCGENLNFDAQEGKRHSSTLLDFDNERHKLKVTAKDLLANTTVNRELEIPPCTYEISGALMALRALQLDPGKKVTLPVTDGKKVAGVRAEAQEKEKLTIDGKPYNTIRYETFVFNNVLYRRKGRLFIWLTDDALRVPVQLRFQFGFPIGDITLELDKVTQP